MNPRSNKRKSNIIPRTTDLDIEERLREEGIGELPSFSSGSGHDDSLGVQEAQDDSLGILEDDSLGILEEDYLERSLSPPGRRNIGLGNEFLGVLNYPQYGTQIGVEEDLWRGLGSSEEGRQMNLEEEYLEDTELPSFDSVTGDTSFLPEIHITPPKLSSLVPQSPPASQRSQVARSPEGPHHAAVHESPQALQGAPVPQSPQVHRSPPAPQSLQVPESFESSHSTAIHESPRITEPLPPMSRLPPENYNFFGLLEPVRILKPQAKGFRDAADLIDLDQIQDYVPIGYKEDERPAWYEFLRSEILNIFHKYQVDINYDDFISPQTLMSALRFYIDDLHVKLQKYATISQAPEIAASLSPEQELTQFESAPYERPTSAVGEVVEQLQNNLNELRDENLQLHEISFDLEAELAYAESRISQMERGTSALDRIDLKEQFMGDLEARNAAASQLNSSLHSDLNRERLKVSRLMTALNEAQRKIADLAEKEMTYVSILETLPEGDLNERIAEKMTRMAEAYVGRTRPPNAYDVVSIRDEWARMMRAAIQELEEEYKELVLDKIQQEELVRDKLETVRQLKLQEADVDNQIRNIKKAIALKKEDIEKQKRVAMNMSPQKEIIQELSSEVGQSSSKRGMARDMPSSKQIPSSSKSIRATGRMIHPPPEVERRPQTESKKISPERAPIQDTLQTPAPSDLKRSPRQISPQPEAVGKELKKAFLKVPGRISPVPKQIPETRKATISTGQAIQQGAMVEQSIPGIPTSKRAPEAPRSIRTFGQMLPRPRQFQKLPSELGSTSKTIQLPSPRRPTPLNVDVDIQPKQTEKGDQISCDITLNATGGKMPNLRKGLKPPGATYKGSGAGAYNRRLSIPKKF